MSARQTSKFIFKLTCIHVQIFTNEYYEKSVFYSLASFPKIHMNMVTNLNDTSDKYTRRL